MTRPRLFRKRSRATSTSMGVSRGQRPVQTDQLAALMIPVIAIVGHTSRVLPAGAEAGGIAHERVQLLCDMFGVGRIKDDTQVMVPHDLLQNISQRSEEHTSELQSRL